jgi:hypothetical protein
MSLTSICSALDCKFGGFNSSNISLSCGRLCDILRDGFWFLSSVWESELYYTPEGTLDGILIVAYPLSPKQSYCQEAEGKVQCGQGKIHANRRPAIFTREGLETLWERKYRLWATQVRRGVGALCWWKVLLRTPGPEAAAESRSLVSPEQ